jgi:hypothetical protein
MLRTAWPSPNSNAQNGGEPHERQRWQQAYRERRALDEHWGRERLRLHYHESGHAAHSHEGAVHMQITTIGLDIAKNVFQIHGIDAAEKVVIRKQLRRGQVMKFFAAVPPCLVGMEACATAHHWAREPALARPSVFTSSSICAKHPEYSGVFRAV